MFRLTQEEAEALVSQNVIPSKRSFGGRFPTPSPRRVLQCSPAYSAASAVLVNIEIMRTFVRLRQMLSSNTELSRRLDDLEKKYDMQFRVVFDTIRQLTAPPAHPQRRIGFHVSERE